MKVHSAIQENRPELVEPILDQARKLGMEIINFDKFYTLEKLGAKNKSPRGYPDAYTVCKGGIYLIGNERAVALYMNGIAEWFKTSAIVGVEQVEEGIRLETENSYYLLR